MPADVFGGPFGEYTAMTGSGVIDGTGKDEIGVILAEFALLFNITLTAGNGVTGAYALIHNTDSPHPDFDNISVEMRNKIGVELAALWDFLDAADEA